MELDAQWPMDATPAGIYVHIPFCSGKCDYCGFISFPHDNRSEHDYIKALIREIAITPINYEVNTIYFGGGSPSLLSIKSIERSLQALQKFNLAADTEISFEVNPSSYQISYFRDLIKTGINRVSLGIQSFSESELELMGRRHSARQAIDTFMQLREAGFDNISVDLLAGYPKQSLSGIRRNLDTAFRLSPEHISIYLLEVKPETKLDRELINGVIEAPDDDVQARQYELICKVCREAGYEHYEISNFAKPGRHSRHNLKYWNDEIYYGFGVAAHGMTSKARHINYESLSHYINAANLGIKPIAEIISLTPNIRFKDALIMGARQVSGIDLNWIGERYCVDAYEFIEKSLDELAHYNLYTLTKDRFRFTQKGLLLSNLVFSRWID